METNGKGLRPTTDLQRLTRKKIKNMKPKKEEASAILNEFGDIVVDTEERKMVYSYHYKNLLMQKNQKHK